MLLLSHNIFIGMVTQFFSVLWYETFQGLPSSNQTPGRVHSCNILKKPNLNYLTRMILCLTWGLIKLSELNRRWISRSVSLPSQIFFLPSLFPKMYTWECTPVRNLTVVLNVTFLVLCHIIWRSTWVCTLVRSPSVVLNVIILVLNQLIWRFTWECTLVRNLTVVLSVNILVPNQIIWRDTWECTPARNLTVVLSVIILVPYQTIWRDTWECTLARNLTVVLNVIILVLIQVIWRNILGECTLVRSLTVELM